MSGISLRRGLARIAERAAQAERAAIVAWLRKGGANTLASEVMKDLADAIERGDHITKEERPD